MMCSRELIYKETTVSRKLRRADFLRWSSAVGAALLCAPLGAQGRSSAPARLSEEDALRLQRRLFDGMIAHDLPGLSKLLDEKLVYIHINGVTQNSRQEFLDWVDTGPKFKTFDFINPKVFIYDDAVALT